MADARYRDADFADRPLRLSARSAEDLAIISALAQDAVGRAGEVSWMPRRRRLAILINRFRWEDRANAERDGRPYERVRAALLFDGVLGVRARGVDPKDRAAPISLLRIDFAPEPARPEEAAAPDDTGMADDGDAASGTVGDGTGGTEASAGTGGPGGTILLALSGGGELSVDVECLDACLLDLTRPWVAPSRHVPRHEDGEGG